MLIRELFKEDATIGGTSAGMVAAIPNPAIAVGDKKTRKKFGKGGAPNPPKAIQATNPDGTSKNALDLPNTSLFGGKLVKR